MVLGSAGAKLVARSNITESVARRVGAGIDWREGDAAVLPLHDGDRCAALAEGGRLALSAWGPEEEVPICGELRHIAERQVGPIVDRRHSFGEAGLLEALLRDAGFLDFRSKTLSRTIRFNEGGSSYG